MRLNVAYHGQRIGQILDVKGTHYFEYDVLFMRQPLPLSPLHLPVQRGVTEHRDGTFAGLPGLIYDSLPDGFGQSVIRQHFREKGMHSPSPLQVLSYLGDRTMGALTYSPPAGDSEQSTAVDLVNAARSARKLVEHEHGPLLDPALIQAGGTAGGMQPKILASMNDQGTIVTGADAIPDGYTPWLIKLNTEGNSDKAYAPLEHAYFQMARDCGIQVPQTRLLIDHDGVRHFAIRRFDRSLTDPNQRIHTHTYAAVAGVDYQSLSGSYDHLFETTLNLTRNIVCLREQVLRAVFNVLAHNCDDHAKNFSFQMSDQGDWAIAPAYDLSMAQNQTQGNWLSVNGKRSGISAADFAEIAEPLGISRSEIDAMFHAVSAVTARWPEYSKASGVGAGLSKAVEAALNS
ncbi:MULTISPECIES: type II toxin-antitoxin system HipA family toxin [unclassified Lentimonas]|uniref:type II toxin-antitoxin system HipA family toxin n=1 Tax=unclassified Lentimonas TaxID=2630993 RepID=UPI001326239E|nr:MULTISPECIES: type II toxin-antitoxin system HipA family toxin [unclassified Lentimonas]CAA6691288.1 Unannotated [Lentimonas sp. CC10]CAA6695913.1 Unannotated [Lentimonas sp. CC19]CAA7068667.1 Unannotated [Lentimonas sp. CC11]